MNKPMNVIFKAIALAMGVAVVVMSILGSLNVTTGNTPLGGYFLLGIGLSSLAIDALRK